MTFDWVFIDCIMTFDWVFIDCIMTFDWVFIDCIMTFDWLFFSEADYTKNILRLANNMLPVLSEEVIIATLYLGLKRTVF